MLSLLFHSPPPVTGNLQASIKAVYFQHEFPATTENIPTEASFGILLDKTNFYSEQGGQEYDIGNIMTLDGESEFVVENCQSFGGYVLHIGFMKYGKLNVNDTVEVSYDQVSVLRLLCSLLHHAFSLT
jgi:alanyl-tRNA synthetase